MIRNFVKIVAGLGLSLFVANCGNVNPISSHNSNGNATVGTAVAMTPQGEINAGIAKGGTTYCFARGTDNNLYYRSRPKNGSWSTTWTSLGGPITGNIQVIDELDGNDSVLYVFTKGTSNYPVFRSLSATGSWSGWTYLTTGPQINSDVIAGSFMTADRRASSGIRLVVRNSSSNKLWTVILSSGVISANWMEIPNCPVVGDKFGYYWNGLYGLVIARDANNYLIEDLVTPTGSTWVGWGSFSTFATVGEIAMAVNLDTRLEIFAMQTDHSLWHRYRTDLTRVGYGNWSGWEQLSVANTAYDFITPTINLDGRLELFVKSTASYIKHIYQVAPNGGWGSLGDFENGSVPTNNHLGAAMYGDDGRLSVYAKCSSWNNVYYSSQNAVNSWWNPFTAFNNN